MLVTQTDIDAYMTGDPSDPSTNGTYFTNPIMFIPSSSNDLNIRAKFHNPSATLGDVQSCNHVQSIY